MFIYRVLEAFRGNRVKFAIAGGWAVALHGAVRGTVDLDVVVALTVDNLERAEAALRSIGLESRPPVGAEEVITFREEYIKNRKMLAWRFTNPQDASEVVDILIINDLRKLKTESVRVGARQIPVVSRLDLIKMKKKSGRPQDLEDVKALEALD